jgi:lipid-binding SYLF domain-containing protein
MVVVLAVFVTLTAAAQEGYSEEQQVIDAEAREVYSKEQQVIDKAKLTLEKYAANPNIGWTPTQARYAKAILIIPQLLKGAFLFGFEGGTGVLLVRDEETGQWSQPAFYKLRTGSFGLQIGAQSSDMVFLVMTVKGVESFYTSSFRLGGDVSIALGPVGAGAKGQTSLTFSFDMLAYTTDQGAFAGISAEGAGMITRPQWNEAYYGEGTRPTDILVRRTVSNPGSDKLRAAVAEVMQ